jgi:hypothetical protein
MKNILITILALMLMTWLLAPGCATTEQDVSRSMYRGYESRSWWGSDPTCSPGCPTGLSGGY